MWNFSFCNKKQVQEASNELCFGGENFSGCIVFVAEVVADEAQSSRLGEGHINPVRCRVLSHPVSF